MRCSDDRCRASNQNAESDVASDWRKPLDQSAEDQPGSAQPQLAGEQTQNVHVHRSVHFVLWTLSYPLCNNSDFPTSARKRKKLAQNDSAGHKTSSSTKDYAFEQKATTGFLQTQTADNKKRKFYNQLKCTGKLVHNKKIEMFAIHTTGGEKRQQLPSGKLRYVERTEGTDPAGKASGKTAAAATGEKESPAESAGLEEMSEQTESKPPETPDCIVLEVTPPEAPTSPTTAPAGAPPISGR